MSATTIGFSGGLVSKISYSISEDGRAKYRESIQATIGSSYTAPLIGETKVVDGETLQVTSVQISARSGSFTQYEIEYSGRGSSSSAPPEASIVEASLTGSTQEEPIASNYHFAVPRGGSPSLITFSGGAVTEGNASTTGGALFSQDGEFLGFTKYAKARLFGVQSYLNANITYSLNFVTGTRPSLDKVGKIMSSVSGAPTLESGKNWMLASITYRKQGSDYSVTQTFQASGESGWNTYIYGSAVSPPPTS
jgi:hypothetical protein